MNGLNNKELILSGQFCKQTVVAPAPIHPSFLPSILPSSLPPAPSRPSFITFIYFFTFFFLGGGRQSCLPSSLLFFFGGGGRRDRKNLHHFQRCNNVEMQSLFHKQTPCFHRLPLQHECSCHIAMSVWLRNLDIMVMIKTENIQDNIFTLYILVPSQSSDSRLFLWQ